MLNSEDPNDGGASGCVSNVAVVASSGGGGEGEGGGVRNVLGDPTGGGICTVGGSGGEGGGEGVNGAADRDGNGGGGGGLGGVGGGGGGGGRGGGGIGGVEQCMPSSLANPITVLQAQCGSAYGMMNGRAIRTHGSKGAGAAGALTTSAACSAFAASFFSLPRTCRGTNNTSSIVGSTIFIR